MGVPVSCTVTHRQMKFLEIGLKPSWTALKAALALHFQILGADFATACLFSK